MTRCFVSVNWFVLNYNFYNTFFCKCQWKSVLHFPITKVALYQEDSYFKLCRKSNINKLIEIVCMTKPIQLKLGFELKERLAKFRKRNPFLKRLALSTYEKELLGYHRWTGAITLKTRGDKYEMSNEQLIIKKGYFIAIDVNFMRSAVIVCVTRGWGWEVSFVSYYRYFWMHGAGFL